MAGNKVTLEFAGDAKKLAASAKQAEQATTGVADRVSSAAGEMTGAAAQAGRYEAGLGRIGSAATGMSTALGDAGGTMSALVEWQRRGADRAAELARAQNDVEQANVDASQAVRDLRQAQLDLTQAQLDGRQAAADVGQAQLDVKQAALDAEQAAKDYAAAVKEHGKGSIEARQAALDLAQAQQDSKQAGIDLSQAQADAAQAQEDGRQATVDATQAQVDAKAAALDLAEAQRAANPSDMGRWAQDLELASAVVMGVVGAVNLLVMAHSALSIATIKSTAAQVAGRVATIASSVAAGIATAAQWLWNVAMTANPIGIIIVAVAALVAAIIWLATKTTFFQTIWKYSWGAIKAAAAAVWNWLKTAFNWLGDQFVKVPGLLKRAFSGLFNIITAPWRAAFNFIAKAWNNTVGRLRFSIPSWVPGVGGNSFSAPRLPTFHRGGIVPGSMGSEVLSVLQAGERVDPAGGAAPTVLEIRSGGSRLDDAIVEILLRALRTNPAVRLAVSRG